jgi:hypothetical protein
MADRSCGHGLIVHIVQRQPEDFESVLTRLKRDIERKQTHLSELRLRERRTTLLITLWTLGFWAIYSSAWYTQPGLFPTLVGRVHGEGLDKVVKAVPAVTGPIVYVVLHIPLAFVGADRLFFRILFARRIVQTWYSRKEKAEGSLSPALRPLSSSLFCRKDTPESPQGAAPEGRGVQEEDQVLRDSQPPRAVRRDDQETGHAAAECDADQNPNAPGHPDTSDDALDKGKGPAAPRWSISRGFSLLSYAHFLRQLRLPNPRRLPGSSGSTKLPT